jgi:hypothetical protein
VALTAGASHAQDYQFRLALGLTAVGAFGLIYLFLFADGWYGWMVMGAGLLFTVGVV